MTKKIVWVRGGPEMNAYPMEVIVPRRLKKGGTPPPPPNFLPVNKVKIIGSDGELSLHKPQVLNPNWENEDAD